MEWAMRAVTIHDAHNESLSFDLVDLLVLLGPVATLSAWKCRGVEAAGPGAEVLHSASDSGEQLTGTDLVAAAKATHQVIDGNFVAWRPGETQPWLAIRAVDSSFYVVVTSADEVIVRIRERFGDVRDSPGDTAYLA